MVHTGQGVGPMYGDYEAQRHWQEITVNLPANEWYKNSTEKDLLYWGLDYPPLTAYHSFVVGKIGKFVNPTWTALNSSRGMESDEHKLFMRYSVLISELLVYIPSCIFYSSFLPTESGWNTLSALLFYPGLYLIDYGHFQYNTVSLGLFILAVALLDRQQVLLGSVSFSLALNYKQMELYHAMPFFVYILGLCLHQAAPIYQRFMKIVAVGIVVMATFALCWLPYLSSIDDVISVLQRLFPFNRGLFEDKVSNFWCSVNIILKIKNLLPQPTIVTLCAITTLASVVPSSIVLLVKPTMKHFKYALVISSLGFFLFSYQVHDKTILIPIISLLLLAEDEPFLVASFSLTSVFSMLPLLIEDGLLLPSISTSIIFLIIMSFSYYDTVLNSSIHKLMMLLDLMVICKPQQITFKQGEMLLSGLLMISLTICSAAVPPPVRLPAIWPVLISLISCAHFLLCYLYLNYQILYLQVSVPRTGTKIKQS